MNKVNKSNIIKPYCSLIRICFFFLCYFAILVPTADCLFSKFVVYIHKIIKWFCFSVFVYFHFWICSYLATVTNDITYYQHRLLKFSPSLSIVRQIVTITKKPPIILYERATCDGFVRICCVLFSATNTTAQSLQIGRVCDCIFKFRQAFRLANARHVIKKLFLIPNGCIKLLH